LTRGATARSSGPASPAATAGDAAVRGELVADALDEAAWKLPAVCRRADGLDGLERVETRVRKAFDAATLLDGRAVDLFDLAYEERDDVVAGQHDRELVDRDTLTALEDIDTDDVAADRTDAGSHQSERAGTVGEPYPHEEVRHESRLRRRDSPGTVATRRSRTVLLVPSRDRADAAEPGMA
jgi:hypothetical protein